MSYEVPTDSVDFRLSGAPYVVPSSPVADFVFDGRPPVYFAPPPGVVRPYQSDWQTATDRQQVRTTGYATSRPANTSRRQTSHQAQPLAVTSLGLYWGSVAKKETVVSVSHGQSQEKQTTTGDQWRQPGSKEIHEQICWDNSIEAQDQGQALPWNQPPEKDSFEITPFRRVDEFGTPHQIEKTGYLIPEASLLNFSFAGQPYSPKATPAVYFQMGRSVEARVIQPRDSQCFSSFQSNRTGDQPVIVPWGIGQKAKDESVTGNYGGEKNPEVIDKAGTRAAGNQGELSADEHYYHRGIA